jgi:hypothetical protein
MAVLTATELMPFQPVGSMFQRAFSVDVATQSATDEWIVTGLEKIVGVVGQACIGAGGQTSTPNFLLNVQGTAGTAGSSGGDLAIEITDATNATLNVTVIGYRG